jgi:hypothetical protein
MLLYFIINLLNHFPDSPFDFHKSILERFNHTHKPLRFKNISKVLFFLIVQLFLIPLLYGQELNYFSPEKKLSPSLLKKDFDIFCQILEKSHPSLFNYLSENEWNNSKISIYKNLQSPKTEWEFYQLLAQLTAKIRCEHTVLRISQNSYQYLVQESEGLFPFEVKIIDGKLYIFRNLSNTPIIEGAEIVKINEEEISQILPFLAQHISADGNVEISKWYELSSYFSMFYAVLKGEKENFKIQFKDLEINELREFTVQGISYNTFQQRKWQRYPEYNATKKHKKELEEGISILRLKDFEEKREWKRFFKYLSDNQIDKLIIDIRNNKGGLSDEAKKLLQFLIHNEIDAPFLFLAKNQEVTFDSLVHLHSNQKNFSYKFIQKSFLLSDSSKAKIKQKKLKPHKYAFHGKLAILVNGNTSSAAVQLAATLHHYQLAEFFGEETGGTYSGGSGGVILPIVLPHSQIRLDLPMLRYFNNVQPQFPQRGLIPSHLIPLNIDYYFSKQPNIQDIVEESALNWLLEKDN